MKEEAKFSLLNEIQIIQRMVDTDEERQLIITPIINAKEQFQPTSVDLRLGTEFKIIKNVKFAFLDPLKDIEEIKLDVINYTEDIQISFNGTFILHPHEFVLGSTLEYIKLPRDLAGRLEGKSTWGRVGLQIHSTAGFVDPGFDGSLTFELLNVGKVPIPLFPGLRVAQISFYQSADSFIPYKEKAYTFYSGRPGTVGSLYYKLPEFKVFRKIHRKKKTS